jgi:hypothetical protein
MAHANKFSISVCFNPLKKPNHHVRDKKKLRTVTSWMIDLFPELTIDSKICDTCRKQIGQSRVIPSTSQQEDEVVCPDNEDPSFCDKSQVVEILNTSLNELGESPIDKRKLSSKKYAKKKVQKIESTLKKNLFESLDDSTDSNENENVENSVIQNLKDNFNNCNCRAKKIMILTCVPESWGITKIIRIFNAPNYMVRQAKKIIKEKGILEGPNPKPGKNVAKEVVEAVISFYENDEVSRAMPGIKDCITVTDKDGNKTKCSKRLILCNLKEAHSLFKEKFPNYNIAFSKFAELRPKYCILAGAKGTHSVCVCTTHQNVKLMIENSKLGVITDGQLITYKYCLPKMLCNPPAVECYMNDCAQCPGDSQIRNILEKAVEENLVEKVTFRQWISVDRCNLETIVKRSAEFIDMLCEKLKLLVQHDFIAKQQTSFMNQLKENLKDSEFLVTLDFSENYNMVVQDEAQSYHWASGHATVHPFVIYYKENAKVAHTNFVVISDCLEHNTVAVYLFQKKLIDFLTTKFETVPKKLYYFSDGCAAQYKNKKNFTNLCHHLEDFKIEAEWHFFATAHGKGPCDGVGGTVKRLAAKASLQRPYDDQILSAVQLYEWAQKNIPGIHFTYTTQAEHITSEIFLTERFEKSITIKGTQKFHAFIPESVTNLTVKYFSEAKTSFKVCVSQSADKLTLADCTGYVTVAYDGRWWLSYVLDKNENLDEVKVTFLHPCGPSPSFCYPRKPDILWVSITDVLCIVCPVTPTGRSYVLSEKDSLASDEALLGNSE